MVRVASCPDSGRDNRCSPADLQRPVRDRSNLCRTSVAWPSIFRQRWRLAHQNLHACPMLTPDRLAYLVTARRSALEPDSCSVPLNRSQPRWSAFERGGGSRLVLAATLCRCKCTCPSQAPKPGPQARPPSQAPGRNLCTQVDIDTCLSTLMLSDDLAGTISQSTELLPSEASHDGGDRRWRSTRGSAWAESAD